MIIPKNDNEFIELQLYLKQGKDIKTLTEPPYNLKIKTDKDLTLFKYNQFNSDFNIKLVRESRGIIFDNKYNIICHPFHKFGNFGEGYAQNNIDFKHSYIMEKIDGSLIKCYYFNNKWNIGTNGTIYADTATITTNSHITFEDLFYDIISKKDFITLTKAFNKKNTYLFEIIHPKYLRLFYLIGNFSDRNVIKILINNDQKEIEQYINSFPILKEAYYKSKERYEYTIRYIKSLFRCYKPYYITRNKKFFAMKINAMVEKYLIGVLFYLISNENNTVEKYFLKIGSKKTTAIVNELNYFNLLTKIK